VNVAASISPVPSEKRASSEFDANAMSASRVKVNVRSTAGRGRRTRPQPRPALGLRYGRLLGVAAAGAVAAVFT